MALQTYRVTILVAFTIFSTLYLTISPSVSGGDSGELLAEGCSLGTAHPPGYPLFTILVFIIKSVYDSIHSTSSTVKTGFDGDYHVAYRVNIVSAIFTIVAGSLVSESVSLTQSLIFPSRTQITKSVDLGCSRIGSIIYTFGMFAFSPLIWQYAVTAEVFPMNTMFAALLMYLVLLFAKHHNIAIAYFGAFVCGLALCNQHTILLFEAPFVLWILFVLRSHIYKHPSCLLYLSVCFLIGLLPYMYLPLAASLSPSAGSWGEVISLAGFLHHVLRRDYGTFQLYSGNSASPTVTESDLKFTWSHLMSMLNNCITRTRFYATDFAFVQTTPITAILLAVGVAYAIFRAIVVLLFENIATNAKSSGSASKNHPSAPVTPLPAVKHNSRSTAKGQGEAMKGAEKGGDSSSTADRVRSEKSPQSLSSREAALAALTPVVVILSLAFYLVVFHSLSNLPIAGTTGERNELFYGVHQRFWMQPNVVAFYLAGLGFAATGDILHRVLAAPVKYLSKSSSQPSEASGKSNDRLLRVLLEYSLIVASIFSVYTQYKANVQVSDQHQSYYFRDYARAVLMPLPSRAVLVVNADQKWSSLRYLQQCEEVRKDVTLINLSMMTYSAWFQGKQTIYNRYNNQRPQIAFSGAYMAPHSSVAVHKKEAYSFLQFLDKNIPQHKILFTGNLQQLNYPDPDIATKYETVSLGLSVQFTPKDSVQVPAASRTKVESCVAIASAEQAAAGGQVP